MMNVAAPASAPLPSHFAPPARMPSTRRQLYHHPTLHLGHNSNSIPRHKTPELVTLKPSQPQQQQLLSAQYSPPATSPTFQRPTSNQSSQQQYSTYVHGQPLHSLQRNPTSSSVNSLNQYIHTGALAVTAGHHRQTASISTSNSSIIRVPSGHNLYTSTTPPMIQGRPPSMSPADTYVARLRRARATVWSARGQREDLDRSNSKEDKYNKKYSKRGTSTKNKLTSGGPVATYEIGLRAHPRQLMPRLSANEAEDSDYMDPFISGPNFFDTTNTAASTKGSAKTKTTTSSTSPSTSAQNVPLLLTPSGGESKSSASGIVQDGRGSPDPMQSYYKPPVRGQSKRMSRMVDDDINDRQVGGGRRLFVVNASPSESEGED